MWKGEGRGKLEKSGGGERGKIERHTGKEREKEEKGRCKINAGGR